MLRVWHQSRNSFFRHTRGLWWISRRLRLKLQGNCRCKSAHSFTTSWTAVATHLESSIQVHQSLTKEHVSLCRGPPCYPVQPVPMRTQEEITLIEMNGFKNGTHLLCCIVFLQSGTDKHKVYLLFYFSINHKPTKKRVEWGDCIDWNVIYTLIILPVCWIKKKLFKPLFYNYFIHPTAFIHTFKFLNTYCVQNVWLRNILICLKIYVKTDRKKRVDYLLIRITVCTRLMKKVK